MGGKGVLASAVAAALVCACTVDRGSHKGHGTPHGERATTPADIVVGNLERRIRHREHRLSRGRATVLDRKLLVSDLRSDLGTPDLPVFIPSYLNDEELLKTAMAQMNDEELRKVKTHSIRAPCSPSHFGVASRVSDKSSARFFRWYSLMKPLRSGSFISQWVVYSNPNLVLYRFVRR